MVKKGYKHTEIGVIPEDWDVKHLDQIGVFSKGKGIKKDEVIDEGKPCIRYGELYTRYDNVIFEVQSFISLETSINSTKIKEGDILFAGSGETKEEIGKCATYNLKQDAYAGGDVIIFTPTNSDPLFLGYLLNNDGVQKQKSTKAQGDAVVHLYPSSLSKIKIPIPPTLTEQKAISEALTDVDNLITEIGKTIAKKKAIKQGTMQELLKPKDDWEDILLNNEIEVNRGGSPRPIQDYITTSPNGINWIKIGDTSHKSKYIESSREKIIPDGIQKSRQVHSGDFLLSNSMSFGRPYILKIDGCIHDGWLVLQNYDKTFDKDFLYYSLMSEYVFNQYLSIASGSGVLNLNKELVKAVHLVRPKTLEEQKAIAQILNDMDAEIEALEAKKSKTQHIKQGMMQELLTGKTRLVKPVVKKTEQPSTLLAEPEPTYKKEPAHNEYITDAVLIGTMAHSFASKEFPLSRYKYTKVSYLLKRYKQEQDKDYLKKAGGPYKPKTRYGGAEKIAIKNGYVRKQKSNYKGSSYEGFGTGENITEAVDYFKKWYGADALQWIQQFKFTKRPTLELWATVDMAMEDLKHDNEQINLQSIKNVITNNKEWKPKLKKAVFSDDNIREAIKKIPNLFYKK